MLYEFKKGINATNCVKTYVMYLGTLKNFDQFQEHVEIRCENTVAPLMIKGEGVIPNYDFSPDFSVCRLDIKTGGKVDFAITVSNRCRAPLKFYVKKLFEVKGAVVPVPIEKPTTVHKKHATVESKQAKVKKAKKLSPDLTPDEIYSISNNMFQKSNEPPKFLVVTGENDRIEVGAFSKTVIKIRFESPKKSVSVAGLKKSKTKEKSKKDKESKQTKETKNHDDNKETDAKNDSAYLTKYNIYLGDIILVKDFFILGNIK